jgi:predicted transposase YdaD
MAPVANLAEMDPVEVVRRMQERIDREPKEEAALLWSASAILMGLRFGREEITKLLRGVRGMKESVYYQMILEEGEVKGEAKGGIKEARRILLRQGQRRFGLPDQAMVATIESTDSIDHLEGWLDRVLEVSSWEELLASLPQEESEA